MLGKSFKAPLRRPSLQYLSGTSMTQDSESEETNKVRGGRLRAPKTSLTEPLVNIHYVPLDAIDVRRGDLLIDYFTQ